MVLLAGLGSGCEALLFEMTGPIPGADAAATMLTEGQVLQDCVRFLSLTGSIDLDCGVRAESEQNARDTGYGGLPLKTKGLANDLWMPYGSAPGTFAQLAGAYAARHGVYTQLEGRAGVRKRQDMDFGLTHNLGESPYNSVAAVSILGRLN